MIYFGDGRWYFCVTSISMAVLCIVSAAGKAATPVQIPTIDFVLTVLILGTHLRRIAQRNYIAKTSTITFIGIYTGSVLAKVVITAAGGRWPSEIVDDLLGVVNGMLIALDTLYLRFNPDHKMNRINVITACLGVALFSILTGCVLYGIAIVTGETVYPELLSSSGHDITPVLLMIIILVVGIGGVVGAYYPINRFGLRQMDTSMPLALQPTAREQTSFFADDEDDNIINRFEPHGDAKSSMFSPNDGIDAHRTTHDQVDW